MREVKFRAWANNKWWYSDDEAYLLKEYDGELWLVEDTQFYLNDNPRYAKIGKAIQYTGLKDQNGVEIYEGDLVRFSYSSEFNSRSFIGVVEHDTCNPCFVIVNPDNSNQVEFDWVMCGLATLEVTGNIHEEKS